MTAAEAGTSKKSQIKRKLNQEKLSLKLAPRPSKLVSYLFALRSLPHISCSVLYCMGLTLYIIFPGSLAKYLIISLANESHQKVGEMEKPRYFFLFLSAWNGVFGDSWVSSVVVAFAGQFLLLNLSNPGHQQHKYFPLFL